jgi:hypothetical protein
MKYWFIGLAIAVLGFGEYVYVNVAPYPPAKRVQMAQQIPFVKDVVDAWQLYRLEKWSKEGNPWASASLYHEGRRQKKDDAMARALERLRTSGTAAARFSLYMIDRRTDNGEPVHIEWSEFLALRVMAHREGIRVPTLSDEQHEEFMAEGEEDTARIYDRAAQGDSLSMLIVERLDREQH